MFHEITAEPNTVRISLKLYAIYFETNCHESTETIFSKVIFLAVLPLKATSSINSL